ncbi:cysteine rich repeat-containing protein [Methylocystis sp.]|uniref:cysteine rich repeat-containing protein n=1 Tax=Methylocystis sp. TaxID=1911079 RepID=UPI0025E2D398|nr:cysteine rich repeat-containing protein [Methylocystis sp.]
MRRFLSLLPIVCCFAISPAQALPGNQISDEVKEKCKADYAKLCSGVMPGGGRILACFQAHKDEVSPDCRDALSKVKN